MILQSVLSVAGTLMGAVGLLVAFANYQNNIRLAKPKLRVLAQLAFPGRMDEMIPELYLSEEVENAIDRLKTYYRFEISNLGCNTQSILEAGLKVDERRCAWRHPDSVEPRQTFPLAIKPGQTIAVYYRVFKSNKDFITGVPYVLTDCGDEFTGLSPLIDDLRAAREREAA